MTRTHFLKLLASSFLGLHLFPLSAYALNSDRAGSKVNNAPKSTFDNEGNMLRTIAYNVFNGCIGYKGINGGKLPPGEEGMLLKNAREMGQIPQRIALELALYRPNIINFSESAKENIVAEMAKMLGLHYTFFPGAKSGEGNYPGSILSAYEIFNAENRPFVNKSNDTERLFTRHWGKATLRLPDGKVLVVHSAHLWPFKKEENDTRIRLDEIKELAASIRDDLAHGADSVLLQGDLNHTPDTPEHESLKDAELVDVFAAVGSGPGYTTSLVKPARRIDYIYAAGNIAQHINHCEPLFQGNFRMNGDDPKGFALSDHIPVLADFELQ